MDASHPSMYCHVFYLFAFDWIARYRQQNHHEYKNASETMTRFALVKSNRLTQQCTKQRFVCLDFQSNMSVKHQRARLVEFISRFLCFKIGRTNQNEQTQIQFRTVIYELSVNSVITRGAHYYIKLVHCIVRTCTDPGIFGRYFFAFFVVFYVFIIFCKKKKKEEFYITFPIFHSAKYYQ